MARNTKWSFEAEYIQACNCDYGCPCNFNALPTRGNCEALEAFNVRKGSFDGTKLAGVRVAWGLWWPKAIHEGGGTSRLYIDNASPAQRRAIEEIFGGRQGGGVFQVFNTTFAKVLPSTARRIEFRYDGYNSRFSVEDVGEVRSSNVKNPVTGDAFKGEVLLPGGINFKRAFVTSVDWSLHDMEFQFDHRKAAGFVTITKYTDKGPVGSNPVAKSGKSSKGPPAKKRR